MREAKITFWGGTGSVTGANFHIDTGGMRLVVDCGLVQGGAYCDSINYEPFPYPPPKVDVLVITHAHLDHIGRIPKLVKDGFSGRILSTPATRDLATLMLDDAVGILTEEAARTGRLPLYEREHIAEALRLWQVSDYGERTELGDGVSLTFKDAGHILGSALAFFEREGRVLVMTGDLGNSPDVLLKDTDSIKGAHYLVMESVYGDRNHKGRDHRRDILAEAIIRAEKRHGTLLIPSFSVQRTQVLLSEIHALVEEGKVPSVPVYLDSPLAIQVLDVYRRYPTLYNDTIRSRMERGEDPFAFSSLTLTPHSKESAAIEEAPDPKIIIAGSGMSQGGRIRMHEKRYLSDKNATILFVGYQTVGTLGRRILDGAPRVEIDGEWVKVRAEVEELMGYSAHKDRDHLVSLVAEAAESLEKAFVVMGEPRAALFLTQRLRDFLGVDATAPEYGAVHTLSW